MYAPLLQRPITTYAQAEALLLGLVRDDPRPYASHAFEGVRLLLEALGNPQQGLPCLHIAGSKGKGSVALMSEALFEAYGIRTATFSSPHLRRWTERFRIAGRELSEALFLDTVERIRPILVRVAAHAPERLPSFFDVLCAAALLVFREADVELAIIECGLGGRYDATNVIAPELCCITSIELEHTAKLGKDIGSIAAHKAGIIKPGVPIVCGRMPAQAMTVIAQQARQLQAPQYHCGADFTVETVAGVIQDEPEYQSLRYRGSDWRLAFNLSCYGRPMAENAALALTLLHLHGRGHPGRFKQPFDSAPGAACLGNLSLPGRGQILSRQPLILVDAAHTPESLALLGQHLEALAVKRRQFLVSVTRGKNLQALAQLLKSAWRVTVTCVDPLRSMPAEELAAGLAALCPQLQMTVIEDPRLALDAARDGLRPDQSLCLCGSVYLAGFALEQLAGAPDQRYHQ